MKMPIPIRGPFALPFRVFGITHSKMNPDICTICERSFRRVKKSGHFTQDATILFSDIRGYTHLSHQVDPHQLSEIVSTFQDQCAQCIWKHGGIVNKQMGDGLMAIFNFPIKARDHAAEAVAAALNIQESCKQNLAKLADGLGVSDNQLGVGIGIHSGDVEIGEFSKSRSDFTAIGSVVNMAARLEGEANPGEIVMSQETGARVSGLQGAVARKLHLKGIDRPVDALVL